MGDRPVIAQAEQFAYELPPWAKLRASQRGANAAEQASGYGPEKCSHHGREYQDDCAECRQVAAYVSGLNARVRAAAEGAEVRPAAAGEESHTRGPLSSLTLPPQAAQECGHVTPLRWWTATGEWCNECYTLARRVLGDTPMLDRPTVHHK